jgi:tRNA (guanine-N7-)-methyltransferase
MARTKLKRLSKLSEISNVFNIKQMDIKESVKSHFKGENLFTLEIGCGHGDYSVELAQKFSDRNFIGIDVKGARLYKGATKALELNLNNVAFIITRAEKLGEIFESNSVEEIYIPFPEPHVKRSKANKRLISPLLLKLYKELLADSGLVHFKTDDKELYEYAVKSIVDSGGTILNKTDDLFSYDELKISQSIITSFEKHYIDEGKKIKYICFRF